MEGALNLFVPPSGDEKAAKLLYDLQSFSVDLNLILCGLEVVAASWASLRANVFPRMLSAFGLILAPICVVGGLVATVAGSIAANNFAFFLLVIWTGLSSAVLVERRLTGRHADAM